MLTQVLKLIDNHDLYGSVAYPKRHTQKDISDIYRLSLATHGVFTNVALQEPFGLTVIEVPAVLSLLLFVWFLLLCGDFCSTFPAFLPPILLFSVLHLLFPIFLITCAPAEQACEPSMHSMQSRRRSISAVCTDHTSLVHVLCFVGSCILSSMQSVRQARCQSESP